MTLFTIFWLLSLSFVCQFTFSVDSIHNPKTCKKIKLEHIKFDWTSFQKSGRNCLGDHTNHGQKNCKDTKTSMSSLLVLIEFIDRGYSQSFWYFRPLLWTSATLTFSWVYSPLPYFPVWISTEICIYKVLPVLARHEHIDDWVDARCQVDEDVAGYRKQVEWRVVEYL